jgi:oxygen-independent coproporphyrinogen III oxidase
MKRLAELLDGPLMAAYTYCYPHKTAHRPLNPTVALHDVWSAEDRRALFLYLHVPFCPHRCGYCNLFSLARPEKQLVNRWLDAISVIRSRRI